MLFRLGEYDEAARTAFGEALQRHILAIAPALDLFETVPTETVPTARIPIHAERVLEVAPNRLTQRIVIDPGRAVAGDVGAVLEALDAAAAKAAKSRLEFMSATLEAMTDATGRVARVGPQMNWDDMMDVLEQVDVGFGEHGEPRFALWPPSAQAAFDALPPRTAAQEVRWRELMEHKQEEERARRRDRRLR